MPSNRETLLLEHQRACDQLATQQRALGRLLPDERRIKVETFLTASGSDKVRENAGAQASLHLTTVILTAQREIDALQVEIDNIRLQLHYS